MSFSFHDWHGKLYSYAIIYKEMHSDYKIVDVTHFVHTECLPATLFIASYDINIFLRVAGAYYKEFTNVHLIKRPEFVFQH